MKKPNNKKRTKPDVRSLLYDLIYYETLQAPLTADQLAKLGKQS